MLAAAGAAHTSGEILIAQSCASRGRAYVCPHYCSSTLREVAEAYLSKSTAKVGALFVCVDSGSDTSVWCAIFDPLGVISVRYLTPWV